MSLQLETLDQLLCGDMPLQIIRGLYPDDSTFAVGIHALAPISVEPRRDARINTSI